MNEIVLKLKYGLIPAVPTPFTRDGAIHVPSLERYAEWMSSQPVAGAAVWAHTGRGLMLSREQRELILKVWRKALSKRLIIAGAGGSPKAESDNEYIQTAVEMARHAKSLGANALLSYAPVRFRNAYDQDKKIIEYHQKLASVGLPVILFYLYEAAGGISYSEDVLRHLLGIEQVIGIKIATLDSVMTYQDVSRVCQEAAPRKLIITGEDRFLGYSFMAGAEAALIGMGAAFTKLQYDFMQAYFNGNHTRFIELNSQIDLLAQATFIRPMEGYIARMSYLLVQQGIFGNDAWYDPWGPMIEPHELRELDRISSLLPV